MRWLTALIVLVVVVAALVAPAAEPVELCNGGEDILVPPLAAPMFMAFGASEGICPPDGVGTPGFGFRR